MKVAALIFGILGGLVSITYGLIGFGVGAMGDSGGMKFLSIAVPLAALLGAGLSMSKPVIAAGLMGGSAVIFVLLLGFNFFTLVPVILLGLGAVFAFLAAQEANKVAS